MTPAAAQSRPVSRPLIPAGSPVIGFAIAGAFLAATLARFWAMQRGSNFDLASYKIVVDLVSHGKNVYANTPRYNYGPAWFLILGAIDSVARRLPHSQEAFRIILVSMLTVVDLLIARILQARFGWRAALFFFASPIAIIITGYHNQFDNLAILIAMSAVIVYDDGKEALTRRKFAGLLLLGLSLVVKHVFFLFPFWLAVKERGWRTKAITLLLPLAVFGVSFVPYWGQGKAGIVANVFKYRSFDNQPLLTAVLPNSLQGVLNGRIFWFAALSVAALGLRRYKTMDSLLMYTLIVVAFSPSVANQYLAIVIPAVSAFLNVFFVGFVIVGTALLFVHPDGLHFGPPSIGGSLMDKISTANPRSYDLAIFVLALGIAWHLWSTRSRDGRHPLRERISDELRWQIRSLRK